MTYTSETMRPTDPAATSDQETSTVKDVEATTTTSVFVIPTGFTIGSGSINRVGDTADEERYAYMDIPESLWFPYDPVQDLDEVTEYIDVNQNNNINGDSTGQDQSSQQSNGGSGSGGSPMSTIIASSSVGVVALGASAFGLILYRRRQNSLKRFTETSDAQNLNNSNPLFQTERFVENPLFETVNATTVTKTRSEASL